MNNKILDWQNPQIISLVTEALKNENICIASTDTVLGLLANVSQKGFEKLNKLKKRSAKSYIVLIGSLQKLEFFVDLDFSNKKNFNFIDQIWPSPVTLIFKSKKDLPAYLKSSENTIAIRMPNHAGLLQLLTFFNGLYSSSANLSGEPIPETFSDLDSVIIDSCEYAVLNNLQENYRYPIIPSTILDLTSERIKIVREGVVPIIELEKIYGEKFTK